MLRKFLLLIILVAFLGAGFWIGRYTDFSFPQNAVLSPLSLGKKKELPLLQYSIPNLLHRQYQSSDLTITSLIEDFPEYSSYEFSFVTLGKRMSGQVNIPKSGTPEKRKSIVLVRGFVPLEMYTTGVGTKNAAAVFAKQGYLTFAPDFFGYGKSDPEVTDNLEARFQKPIEVVELLNSLKTNTISWNISPSVPSQMQTTLDPNKIGIWAHSNGGQIALTTLEILNSPLPTTLWAPVSAPFPYSVLFFTDEEPDEGKASRLWIAEFDRQYNAVDFSLTDHLDLLKGPLQLHQGAADEAVPKVWSDEFVAKLKKENTRRQDAVKATPAATQSAVVKNLEPIEITYYTYLNTDHNMRPSWDTVIQRDVDFFAKQLQ
jgi:pimeloyl-ACP methyl ester carboxylesterase